MMANNYESLKTDGHYTLARRIFLKIKSWAEPKSVPITWANYQALVNLGTDDPNVNYMIIDGISGALLDCFYPVGSYYETSNTSFDPNISFGGTWVLETEGLVHVSSGSNYAVTANNKDGGEATHKLIETEMPQHAHGIGWYENKGQASTGSKSANMVTQWWNVKSTPAGSGEGAGYPFWITNAGGNQAHNNMQPYKIVNRWHRTA